jgi:hypothetical protein
MFPCLVLSQGLSPHLQRAHAGRTPCAAANVCPSHCARAFWVLHFFLSRSTTSAGAAVAELGSLGAKTRFMKKRPTSVTIIAWILLVINALSLLGSIMAINNPMAQEQMAKSPIPIPLQYVMIYLGLSISILCAIFMLRAANWARLLYDCLGRDRFAVRPFGFAR